VGNVPIWSYSIAQTPPGNRELLETVVIDSTRTQRANPASPQGKHEGQRRHAPRMDAMDNGDKVWGNLLRLGN
jgi:hypothetical protein